MNVRESLIGCIEGHLAGRCGVREYPSLSAQAERFAVSRPFAGRALLDCTPVFANTLLKYVPLLKGGAELTVGVSERIPHDPAVVRFLGEVGVPVLRDSADAVRMFDVILDCDGSRADIPPRVGVCELTRSGAYHYAGSRFPVVLVDDSRIKEIETSVGTADGFMRAMSRFGYTDWAGRRVVVFGCGKVGRGVACRCTKAGAAVTVVDRTDIGIRFERARAAAVVDCRDVEAVRAAVKGCDFLVTATGVKGAMKGYGLGPILRERAGIVVAAIGIEDEWLDELDRGRIVNNGVAVNFALDEPTLLRYIDPTMSLSNESAADLLAGVFAAPGIVRPSDASERLCLDSVLACGLIADEIRDL